MPLPIPTLDNRTYAELAAEGRSLIPRLAPRWTDHNAHDPGITLMELFASLVEANIYRLDGISEASQRAFLRLLGIEIHPPQVAETIVAFASITSGIVILPADSIVRDSTNATWFQTTRELNVSPSLLSLFTGTDAPTTDVTAANHRITGSYHPFGFPPQIDDALYFAFDRPLASSAVEITLYVWTTSSEADRITREQLMAEWKIAVAELGEKCVPHWTLHYSARTIWEYRGKGGDWVPLAGVVDETRAFTLSGPVRFTAPTDLEADAQGRFLIRSRLIGGHYECPPELAFIALNAVSARHENSQPETKLGVSTGRAGQMFSLKQTPVVPGSTRLRVVINGKDDDTWNEVWTWDLTGPHRRAYLLSAERGELSFGDGRTSRVPPADAKLYCAYRTGGGSGGNVPAGQLTVAPLPSLQVSQPFAATGGAPAETLADAQARALTDLAQVYRAITLADFQVLAQTAPGLPVARTRALANHHPALPCFEAAGNVTVVVVPRCPDARPEPGPDLLRAVQRYLDRRRIVTTELHVIGPSYTTVIVHAQLHADQNVDLKALRDSASVALNEFFHPLRGGPDRHGWPVGRDVYRSEIIALLAGLPGVAYVDQFGLSTEGDAEPRCGNLPVCASNLVSSGDHQIAVVERKLP